MILRKPRSWRPCWMRWLRSAKKWTPPCHAPRLTRNSGVLCSPCAGADIGTYSLWGYNIQAAVAVHIPLSAHRVVCRIALFQHFAGACWFHGNDAGWIVPHARYHFSAKTFYNSRYPILIALALTCRHAQRNHFVCRFCFML